MTQKLDLFKEVLPSIMQTGKPVLTEDNENEYDAFMVNKALGLNRDCLFYANEMNLRSGLPNAAQYDYLMYSIRKCKRAYVPWPKKAKEEETKLVMRHFNYSRVKAQAAMTILTPDQLAHLKEMYKDIK